METAQQQGYQTENGFLQLTLHFEENAARVIFQEAWSHMVCGRPYREDGQPLPPNLDADGKQCINKWLGTVDWKSVEDTYKRLGTAGRGIIRQKDNLGVRYVQSEAKQAQIVLLPPQERLPEEVVEIEHRCKYLVRGFPPRTPITEVAQQLLDVGVIACPIREIRQMEKVKGANGKWRHLQMTEKRDVTWLIAAEKAIAVECFYVENQVFPIMPAPALKTVARRSRSSWGTTCSVTARRRASRRRRSTPSWTQKMSSACRTPLGAGALSMSKGSTTPTLRWRSTERKRTWSAPWTSSQVWRTIHPRG